MGGCFRNVFNILFILIESFKGQLRTQSLNGGRKGPGEEFGSGGNYWTRENWESYVERTKSTLVGMGADADELDALIKKATANVVFY